MAGRRPKSDHADAPQAKRGPKPKAAGPVLSVVVPSPSADTRRPEPPDGLSSEALAEWGRVVAELEALGQLHPADGLVLGLYAEAWQRYRECDRQLKEQGYLLETGDGGHKGNPLASHVSKSWGQCVKLLAELGLTPASRRRSKVAAAAKVDRLSDFLSRRRGGAS